MIALDLVSLWIFGKDIYDISKTSGHHGRTREPPRMYCHGTDAFKLCLADMYPLQGVGLPATLRRSGLTQNIFSTTLGLYMSYRILPVQPSEAVPGEPNRAIVGTQFETKFLARSAMCNVKKVFWAMTGF